MNGFALTLHGESLLARPAGTLWWPARRLLAVADLHLGKSGRLARRGGALLPPYETAETLSRLGAEIAATDPACVLALGDSFDDGACLAEAAPETRAALARLAAGRDWVWIAGNHDPLPPDLPGTAAEAATIGPLTFRHIADPVAGSEVSGHYHPKARVGGQSRPCFLADARRIILPAFGAYTGGLDCRDPALADLMGEAALAILTGRTALPCPMPRGRAA
jgi:DNA ligase-associated metallophosphoesterase